MLVNQSLEPVAPPFVSGEGADQVQHPPNIEALWSDEELAAIGLFRVVDDDLPAEPITGSALEWDGDVVRRRWNVTLAQKKDAAIAAIGAMLAEKIAAGTEIDGGLHVALDDGSRANMGGMATTALAALSGAAPWPASYSQGWITIENLRFPLSTPEAGLALAAAVGDHYAQLRQHARDLKDAVDAAADAAALAGIDLQNGWPE